MATPSEKGHWLFGHFRTIQREPPLVPHLRWLKETNYPPLLHYHMFFRKSSILVVDPELVKIVLLKEYKSFNKDYFEMAQLLGNGLVTIEAEAHAKHRRIIQPAFNYRFLKDIATEIFPIHTKQFISKIQEKTNQPIDLAFFLSQLTLNIIGTAGFNHDFSSKGEALGNSFYEVLKITFPTITELLFGKRVAKTVHFQREKKKQSCYKALNEEIDVIVKNERANANSKKTQSILSLLLKAQDEETGASLTDQELIDEFKTFMFAGHETTSTLLTWFFYSLCLYPEIQKKVCAEIKSVLGGAVPTADDVENRLPYLSNVVKEVLRVYPPVALVTRNLNTDIALNGFVIPKGTRFVISPYVLHHHPKYWVEPETFNPDRWNKEEKEEKENSTFIYIPFLVGPRNCIGQKFALLEAKIIAAMFLQEFSVSLDPSSPKMEATIAITMRPKEPLKFVLTKLPAEN